jgi:asparagine synthase (glutamine-hydrolysing)
MCGILGGFWKIPPGDLDAKFSSGLQGIAHRGPDDRGVDTYVISGGILKLGHTRLSIIDLSPSGHQPMTTRDGRLSLVFNGEIYNYKEIRQELIGKGASFKSDTDTEVLLEAWNEWGETCLQRFTGMFAFGIYDHRNDELVLARDAFGIKPLFYSFDANEGSFIFGSELPSLLELQKGEPRVNWQRAYDYLEHGLQDGPGGTFILGVNHLPPAHLLRLNLSSGKISGGKAWWAPTFEQTSTLSFAAAAVTLRELFLDSVRLHLRSDVPVGAALSGGVDSSAIVCAMRKVEPGIPIHTFSYIAAGTAFNEEKWIDLVNATVSAIPHKVNISPADLGKDFAELIRTQGEPFNSTSMYAQYRIFQEARACGIPVILEGQGADELMAGYEGYPGQRLRSLLENGCWRKMLRFAQAWRKVPGRESKSPWASLLGQLLPEPVHAWAYKFRGQGRYREILDYRALQEKGVKMGTPWMGRTEAGKGRRVSEALAHSLSEHELPTLLRFGDRNAMRFSVENRVPFLTIPMAEFLLSLPENYLISDAGETKSIFRAAMRGIVPDAILDRRDKIGFVTPMQTWIASNESRLGARVTAGSLSHILRQSVFEEELALVTLNRKALTPRMWRTLNFSLWSQEFKVEGV